MPWANDDIELYHGTDSSQLTTIGLAPAPHNLQVSRCRRGTDFGIGFYLTTYLHQAEQWANEAYYRNLSPRAPNQTAVVLLFKVPRDQLAPLQSLAFIRDTPDFWSLVRYCRAGYSPHNRVKTPHNPPRGTAPPPGGFRAEYDIVYGPVAHWRQTLIYKDCDQVSINNQVALDNIPSPVIKSLGTPTY